MFTRTLFASSLAVVLAVASTAALADGEASYEYPQPVSSTVSRADVLAAAIAARQAGLIAQGEQSVVAEVTTGASRVSRAQVVAELAEARRLGVLDQGEHTAVPTAQQLEQIRIAGLRAAMPQVASR